MPRAKRETVPNNPVGDDFHKLEDDGKRYRVLHSSVGHARENEIIPAKRFGPGAEIQRLIDGGAIIQLSDDEVNDLRESGKLNDEWAGGLDPAFGPRSEARLATGSSAPAPDPVEQAKQMEKDRLAGVGAVLTGPMEGSKPADKPAETSSSGPNPMFAGAPATSGTGDKGGSSGKK